MNKRTPRNFNGIENPAKKIGDLLPDYLTSVKIKISDPREEVFQAWYEAIGEKMVPLTEPVSYVDGILTVKVKSSTLYSLLVQHERPRLLKRLQEKFSIRNICFRIG